MPTTEQFKTRFPEFSSVEDSKVAAVDAQWPCYYGAKFGVSTCDDEIILLVMAHLLTFETTTSAASKKELASKSVGSVSLSYNLTSATETSEFYNTTKYGQRALMLMRNNSGGFFV